MAYKVDRHLGSDPSPAIFHQENEPERDVCDHLWPFYASLFTFLVVLGQFELILCLLVVILCLF